jgi:hypothetical protein
MNDEMDEIIAVTAIPKGVQFDLRSGHRVTLLGRNVEEAERELGRVGDKVQRAQYERLPGPAPEPPVVGADLKKPPE